MNPSLGRIGVWSRELRKADPGEVREAAAELEELGYGSVWIPGMAEPGTVSALEPVLHATQRLVAATGVVNIWVEPASDVAQEVERLGTAHPQRMLLGVGISHAALIGERYRRPLSAMRGYLDELDGASPAVRADRCVLAAIGPKMLAVARERTLGSHTYVMPPEHTALARDSLGQEALLAPELTVVLDADVARARETARAWLTRYLTLPNYANNLRRALGASEDELVDGGSDRLVEAAVAYGDVEAIGKRVGEHLEAGADHVCLQVVTTPGDGLPRQAWRRLAEALL